MISMPLKPLTPHKADTFAGLLGATLIIQYDTAGGQFVPFIPGATDPAGPDNFDIDGVHAYIVNVNAGQTIQLQGTAWGTPAAPTIRKGSPPYQGGVRGGWFPEGGESTSPNPSFARRGNTQYETHRGKWAFVVVGELTDQEAPAHITVRNEGRNRHASYAVADGDYTPLLVDLSRRPVVGVGDRLEIAAHDANGTRVSGPFKIEITPEHIAQAYLPIDIRWGDIIPDFTRLRQNYPNPFNPETWLPYELAEPAGVVITIYDVSGAVVRMLAVGHRAAGLYVEKGRAAHWDGRNDAGERVGSGVYFYQFRAGDYQSTKKMVILK